MRRFTHTFPQRISAFLLCLVLCLGLLPATALAVDAPATLYVGNEQVIRGTETTYWSTNQDTGLLTPCTGSGDDWNVKYDPNTATLTLRRASIQGGSNTVSAPYGAGIYAQGSSNQPVTLTIELIGENTITGTFGIYVNATPPTTPGTDASLVIKKSGDNGDNGSLTVTGTGNSGLHIISGTGDASLTIKNASVDAKTTQTYSSYAGVCVQSGASATNSPNISLSVDGGSLTASGTGSSDGILFYVGSSQATGATTSLTVSENAIVDARNGGISASRTSVTLPTPTPTGDNSSGIVFDDKNGTVYGTVELQENLTIGEGETLTIPEGASLTVPEDKTITVESGGKLEGTPTGSGTVKIAPTITTESLPDGEVGTAYSQTLTATGDTPITWTVSGTLPAGLTLDTNTGTISGIPTAEGSSTFTVKAENSAGSATQEYTLTIKSVPVASVSLNESNLSLYIGKTATLTATVTPENATNQNVTWSSDDTSVATVDADGKVTAVSAGAATITVTTEDGDKTATCAVTVEKPYTPPPYIPPTYAVTVPETTGGTVEVSPSRASSGRRVTITTQPAPGYELESLTVLDSRGSEIALTVQGDGKYTFTMPSRKVTVQASFAPVPLPFEDVPPGAWYEEAVRYAYTHGIMEGMSATKFSPNISLTRAQAVQVLYNLEGQPVVSESATFPDLVYQWYKPAISWAESTGVVDGYEDGTFQPGDSITRQEFAQMLYNYAKYKGHDLTAQGDLSQFTDGNQVQKWALPAMSWANGNALINGHDDGTLEPGGTTIRAQAASILMRFDQNLAE